LQDGELQRNGRTAIRLLYKVETIRYAVLHCNVQSRHVHLIPYRAGMEGKERHVSVFKHRLRKQTKEGMGGRQSILHESRTKQ